MLKILTIFSAALTLAMLYAPQPLLPLFAQYFNISLNKVSLIISFALIPLAFAPLIYGYLLEKFSSKYILITSLFACGILQIFCTFAKDFELFLFLRILQALCFPAILTTLLTVLTRTQSENVQKNVALYVGATTFGGLFGRVMSSFLADLFSWQMSLNFFAVCMIFCALLFVRLKDNNTVKLQKPNFFDFIPFVKDFKILLIFCSIFVVFFSFQAIMSFLPFYAKTHFENISQAQIGFLYMGFIMGIVVSAFISQITKILGSKTRVVILGLMLYILGTLMMALPSFILVFGAMFVFCGGMFICHCVLSALLNLNSNKKGIANGLYLSFYYSGGAFGSILPSFFYQTFGWQMLCFVIAFLLLIILFVFIRFRYYYK
ncbi:MFS transporter [Campylobacter sp. US33a]|uniref:MFS transporter n=1 Tax=Campylobacter sp. US33a TaxID=2498120 RepID=UPI0010674C26|nr:MFS transporter [Campylobacter sp. US33a]TEY04597.1 MFS transporter [Campylobacter sp. US33a]